MNAKEIKWLNAERLKINNTYCETNNTKNLFMLSDLGKKVSNWIYHLLYFEGIRKKKVSLSSRCPTPNGYKIHIITTKVIRIRPVQRKSLSFVQMWDDSLLVWTFLAMWWQICSYIWQSEISFSREYFSTYIRIVIIELTLLCLQIYVNMNELFNVGNLSNKLFIKNKNNMSYK